MTNKQKALLHATIYVTAYVALIAFAVLIMMYVPYGTQIVFGTFMVAFIVTIGWFLFSQKLFDLERKNPTSKN